MMAIMGSPDEMPNRQKGISRSNPALIFFFAVRSTVALPTTQTIIAIAVLKANGIAVAQSRAISEAGMSLNGFTLLLASVVFVLLFIWFTSQNYK
jgi:hypothetical protein